MDRTGRPPTPSGGRLVLWALARGCPRWVPLLELRGQAAVDELIARQDRVRRTGHQCKFKLLPEGETPTA